MGGDGRVVYRRNIDFMSLQGKGNYGPKLQRCLCGVFSAASYAGPAVCSGMFGSGRGGGGEGEEDEEREEENRGEGDGGPAGYRMGLQRDSPPMQSQLKAPHPPLSTAQMRV